MSRLTFRLIFSLVIAVVVVAGVYAGAQALSVAVRDHAKGMYVLSGGLAAPLQNQSVEEAGKPPTDAYGEPFKGGGRDCEKEMDSSDL